MKEINLFNPKPVTIPRSNIGKNASLSSKISSNAHFNPSGSDLSQLVVPSYNDHNVILFGKKIKNSSLLPGFGSAESVEKNAVDIYKEVSPAVVEIRCKVVKKSANPATGEVLEQEIMGNGSGSIIDKEGSVITNFHVINNAKDLTVMINKDKEVPAKVIGADPSTELALLKLEMPKEELAKLPVMDLGDSSTVEIGQTVYALGSPRGLFRSMTHGITSGLDRNIITPDGRMTNDVIQTDAAINPGNSGGALVNIKGEQIGINTQIISNSADSAGIGLAIPINTVKKVIAELKTNGKVIRPYIGLSGGIPLGLLPPAQQARIGVKIDKGVLLQKIIKGSPADLAGLKGGQIQVAYQGVPFLIGGDIITKVDDKPVTNMTDIFAILDEKKIGSEIMIEYYSNDVKRVGNDVYAKQDTQPKKVKLIVAETPKLGEIKG